MVELPKLRRDDYRPLLNFIKNKRIYLALSGGGLGLVCHIGMIKFIEDMGITVERVYGTSAGAIIGGLYAAGMNSRQMMEAVLGLKSPSELFGRGARHFILRALKSEIISLTSPNSLETGAMYNGYKLENYLRNVLFAFCGRDYKLGELKIPYSAIAFKIGSGNIINGDESVKEVFSSEKNPDLSLVDVIRASTSIPAIFPPKRIGNSYYIDGGVVEHLPVVTGYEDWLRNGRLLRRSLAIFAVNLGYGRVRVITNKKIMPHDMVMYAIGVQGKIIDNYNLLRVHRPRKGSSVILVKPRCYDLGLMDFGKIPEALSVSAENIFEQLKGDGFLKETEEDLYKARLMLGLGDRERFLL